MSNDRLLDTPLPFPCMYRPDEHPDAFKLMTQFGGRVPQLLRLWVNFQTCYDLSRKFTDGAIAMEKGESGIYGLAIPAWRMQGGHEPKLVEGASSIVAPSGALAAAVIEARKATDEKPEEAKGDQDAHSK
jgi:hypothetical protein